MNLDATYAALRVDRGAAASVWWASVALRRDAPAPIAALLSGRTRVEVTRDEGQRALAWAAGVAGWAAAEPKPVFLHEPS
jgi:hypothetical protein